MTLTAEQIEKYRRLANSTNALASETAKKKLAEAGVPLVEPKKEEPKKEEKKEEPKKTESGSSEGEKPKGDFFAFEKDVVKAYKKKLNIGKDVEESEYLPTQIKKIIKEGFDEGWSSAIVVNEMAKIYSKLKKHREDGKNEDEFDCDELIRKAKLAKAKQKRAYEKKKNAPKKTEATKAKEKIEGVNKGVEKRASKGKVTLSEIDKLISEYEAAIKKLKGLRAKIKAGEKMAKGGDVDADNKHYDAFVSIKEHTCPCQDKKKMAKGGNIGKLLPVGTKMIYDDYRDKDNEQNGKSVTIISAEDNDSYHTYEVEFKNGDKLVCTNNDLKASKKEKGGEVDEEEDLFKHHDKLPKKVQEIIESYGEVDTYEKCEKMQAELEPLGYTFDYYVDGTPHSLRKIKMEKGGALKEEWVLIDPIKNELLEGPASKSKITKKMDELFNTGKYDQLESMIETEWIKQERSSNPRKHNHHFIKYVKQGQGAVFKDFYGENAFEDAKEWGKKNIDNFNIDMIVQGYGEGGEVEDKKYSAEKAGLRRSKKYASVEMRGGRVYHRRNANQYGKAKGGKDYVENRENRSDKRRYFERGGKTK